MKTSSMKWQLNYNKRMHKQCVPGVFSFLQMSGYEATLYVVNHVCVSVGTTRFWREGEREGG